MDKTTGKIKLIYAEESPDPCVFCDEQNNCNKSKMNSCHVFCG